MKIKQTATEKAWQLHDTLQATAQADFIAKVMKWENCSYEEAHAICTGNTIPKEPEYTLGFKMCDPLMQLAMNAQLRKKDREEAISNFKKTLDPDELNLFIENVEKTTFRQKFRSSLKKHQKE